MTDRPIIFSAPMVNALLAGRKSMTRRLAWRAEAIKCEPCQGTGATPWSGFVGLCDFCGGNGETGGKPSPWQRMKLGDRLWVRENHAFVGGGDPGLLLCAADWQETAKSFACENADKPPKWTPSIHMPRWASRLTLIVKAVKIERLNDMSEADAIAEGITRAESPANFWTDGASTTSPTPEGAFAGLWEHLHGHGSWGANPEIVAVSFDVIRANIDAAPKSEAA